LGHDLSGPARLYDIEGGLGRFGVITPVSEHFCHSCNRLRITSNGRLRLCLFSDEEYDLRALLRDKRKNDQDLYRLIREANLKKPLGTELLRGRTRPEAVISRCMNSIGG
jgi:cyclic pyranopterin phosphate synthase